jgi:uracil-DNA glycosylase family protein
METETTGSESPVMALVMATVVRFPGAQRFLPNRRTLPLLRAAAQTCHGCDLYSNATQTVFGEGPKTARVVLVGEQPGNEEDRQGHPFVGPAGEILDRALANAGIDRSTTYVTNVVKHFRFEERGKRRLHKKPTMAEIRACQPWFEAEMEILKPKVIVCLGATAAQALLGNKFRLMQERGVPVKDRRAEYVVATIHPSAILRTPDTADRQAAYSRFVEELRVVHRLL